MQDATGKVVIDPHNAEYDLLQTCQRKTDSGFGLGTRTINAGIKNPAVALGPEADDATLYGYAHALKGGLGSISGALSSVSFSGGLNRT